MAQLRSATRRRIAVRDRAGAGVFIAMLFV
jgi:hypothetical protein